MNNYMKYLSLFSGIGGFELGIQQAYEQILNMGRVTSTSDTKNRRHQSVPNNSNGNGRWSDTSIPECVGYSEIDKYAIQTYQSHFPEHHNYGDITKINADELPDFDLLVGGFPCQAFSIAGKRKGFEDTRGTLFFEIARILRAKQPRLFLLENVKGLLSHDNGNTFRTIIATIDELGYDCQWQVLNSKNHGVPQNRERVFIIGHLRGTSRPEVFPFAGTSKESIGNGQVSETSDTREISRTLLARDYKDPKLVADYRYDEGLRIRDEFVSPCLTSTHKEEGLSAKPLLIELPNIRRLTPVECERLQGFPDNWTKGSDTQRYKQCGNAVTVNVIRDIMEKLLPPNTSKEE